ncbi:MAG: exonuclease SbcCD subunit D [Lachnospiraceae bacterium]|nr:exonuclease SbcCD subunit D [Lachnospiraceae bacterium]
MRFLHTSDLHIGKRVNGFSMLEDQREILRQIAALAVSEGCGGILLAGDIYDRPSPGAEAVALFDEFLCRLASAGIRVFAISGNHDSPERVAYLGELLEKSGVTVSRKFDGTLQKVALEDEHGRLNIYLLPYVKASIVRRFFPEQEIETCEDAIRAILEREPLELGARNILVCHQFITGAEPGGSEELTVGGLDNISADLLDCFDYVALGHIHGAQKIKRETLRYSGSPLKYSFSEANHVKSVVIVDCNEMGCVEVKKVPLALPRDMREVKGTMEELLAHPRTADYVRVVLTDEEVLPDARFALLLNFPNMMRFAVENSRTKTELEIAPLDLAEEKTPIELFKEFYCMQNGGVEPDERRMSIVKAILEDLQEEDK